MTDERYIDKVRALLAKANDKAATPEEADTYFAKAQQLMAKWAIDDAVLAAAGDKADKIITRIVKVLGSYVAEEAMIYTAIGETNNVKVSYLAGTNMVCLLGFESDLDRVEAMGAAQLTRIKIETAPRNLPPHARAMGKQDLWHFRRSFRLGYSIRLKERLAAVVRTVEHDLVSEGSSTALVLVDRRAQVEDAYNQQNVKQATRHYSYDGIKEGRTAADRADLGLTGVRGSRGSLHR